MKLKLGLGMLIAAGGAAVVLALGAAGGAGRAANDPVRVYLVHGGVAPFQGSSSTVDRHGITIYTTGGQGNTWPTQVLGYLEDIDEHWVVLEQVGEVREGKEVWIPRERVQLIEYLDEASFEAMSSR